MNILLAGANGLLGKSVKEYFFQKGVNVFLLSRSANQEIFFRYDTENIVIPLIEIEFEMLINCAFDYKAREDVLKNNTNIIIINNLLKLYKNNKIKKFINISSVDAIESNVSKYGKLKREIERITKQIDSTISIRLGILDDYPPVGIIKALQNFNNLLWPFRVRIGSKKLPVYLTKLNQINEYLYFLMNEKRFSKKVITYVSNSPVDFNELIVENKGLINIKITVPISLLRFALKCYKFLKMPKIKFNEDSLINLLSFEPKLLNQANVNKKLNKKSKGN